MKSIPILLCITATISLFADSKISPPRKLIKQHHYYGVEANTGALIWLESSTNLYWTPSAFMSNTFTVIYRLQSKLDTVQRVWKAPIQVAQPSPPMPTPIPPMPPMISLKNKANGAGGGTAQAWTTDPNLRLSISLTNRGGPWPTLIVPTGVLSNTITLSVGPQVVIHYPTEGGKLYKCQASDDDYTPGDARKVWIDGVPVTGTGGIVVQYEAANRPRRMYRVLVAML